MASREDIIQFLEAEFPQFIYAIDAVGDKKSIIRHRPQAEDLRPGGTISGPTLFGLADAALYVAILGEIGIIALAVTTNININFLRKPSPNHDLIAHCTLIKVGKTLAVGEVSLYSDGQDAPIAHAVGTYAIPTRK